MIREAIETARRETRARPSTKRVVAALLAGGLAFAAFQALQFLLLVLFCVAVVSAVAVFG